MRSYSAFSRVIITFILFFLIVFLVALALSQEYTDDIPVSNPTTPLDWIAKYRGKKGMGCCGHQDCRIARIRVTKHYEDDFYDLEVNGITVQHFPTKAVHTSEDENDWYCFEPPYADFIGEPLGTESLPAPQPCTDVVSDECSNCMFIAPKM